MRITMLYGEELWVAKKRYIHRMSVAEMTMLKWVNGKTKKDIVRMKPFMGAYVNHQ